MDKLNNTISQLIKQKKKLEEIINKENLTSDEQKKAIVTAKIFLGRINKLLKDFGYDKL